jgi:hypothetical protein
VRAAARGVRGRGQGGGVRASRRRAVLGREGMELFIYS